MQTAGTSNFELRDQGADTWTGMSSFKAETCQESLTAATLVITSVYPGDGTQNTAYTLLKKLG